MTAPASKFAKSLMRSYRSSQSGRKSAERINFSQAQNLKPFTPAQRTGKEQAHDPQML